MMDNIELQRLRDLPIEEVAERVGLVVLRHKCLCPFHDDHHPSLSFNTRKNTYRCFVCGNHGGTIDLVMRYLHKDFKEACSWLGGNDNFSPSHLPSLPSNPSPLRSNPPTPFDARRYERFFDHPWLSDEARKFLFEERRLDERVIRWCRLSSWRDRQGVNWLQIPYYDIDGHLIGIQNRNLDHNSPHSRRDLEEPSPAPPNSNLSALSSNHSALPPPRFRFPQGSQCHIYNLPVLNRLHCGDPLYIAEGCSDCWSLLSAGHKAIAIPSATLLKPQDLDPLLTLTAKLSTPFHMFPDSDEPGERLFLQLKELLETPSPHNPHPTLLIHHHLPPNCKDYSDHYLKTLRH